MPLMLIFQIKILLQIASIHWMRRRAIKTRMNRPVLVLKEPHRYARLTFFASKHIPGSAHKALITLNLFFTFALLFDFPRRPSVMLSNI